MTKLYCSTEDIENYLTISIAVEFESQVEDWINGVSEYIKSITNRDWLADSTESARTYDGNGMQSLEVDDFIGTPTVKTGDEYNQNMVARTDFILYPYNTEHKNTLILQDDCFERGIQNVEVTAKWGFGATVPNDIKHACTVITSAIVLAQTNQDGEVESEKIGNYTVKYKSESHKADVESAMEMLNTRKVILI